VPGATFTVARGINNSGQIVGTYSDASGGHGFLYTAGVFTPLDVPGAAATEADGINTSGQIVGTYFDQSGGEHGFLATPAVIEVTIDIKPGETPNSINLKSQGEIPVAILTTATFDATTVDPSTVRFGADGTEAAAAQSALDDINGDGLTDIILQFNTQGTGIACGDISASLTGETESGQAIQGSDSIQTVGCK